MPLLADPPRYPPLSVSLHHAQVRIWDKSRPRRAKLTLRGHSDVVYRVCFSPNGRVILSASEDGTMRAWDRTEGYTLWVYRVSTPAMRRHIECSVLTMWHGVGPLL